MSLIIKTSVINRRVFRIKYNPLLLPVNQDLQLKRDDITTYVEKTRMWVQIFKTLK